jgi:hypothetical protein
MNPLIIRTDNNIKKIGILFGLPQMRPVNEKIQRHENSGIGPGLRAIIHFD